MISRTIALLALVAVLAAVLAACGSSTGAASVAPTVNSSGLVNAPTTLPSATPAASPLASAAPASTGPTDSPEPSVDSHGVPALEALLPAKVGDVVLERLSLTGKDFYSTGTTDTQGRLDTLLKNLGKTIDDLRIGDAGDPTGRTVLEVGAFQVAGAKPAQLLSEWVASTQAATPGMIKVTNTTIDGRSLTKLVDGTRDVGGTTYAFAKGDTIFLVAADDATLVSRALAQLPKP